VPVSWLYERTRRYKPGTWVTDLTGNMGNTA
jgi:hypothetical protein